MHYINYWFIIALVLGGGLAVLVLWLRNRNIRTTWYDWLIGAIGMVVLIFTIQNFITSFAELVPQAAWMFLLVFGVPALVLLAIATLGVWRRHRAAG